jgi:pimeloyl-ACP methyl ester carboxylesterase
MGFSRTASPIIEAGFVQTPLGRLRFRVTGTGPAVLLFHINRQSSELYRELMEALSGRFAAIAMDYPSYGESEHTREQPSIKDYADCGRAVLDAVGYTRAIVAGEAVGSAVAAAFAGSYSDQCAGVVLMNVPLMPGRASAKEHIGQVRGVASQVDDEDAFATIEAFLAKNSKHAPIVPTRDWLGRVRIAHGQCAADCWQAADALLDFDLAAALERIDVPATLLTGSLSPFEDFRADVESRVKNLVSLTVPQSRFAIGWEKASEVALHIGDLADRSLLQQSAAGTD